MQRANFWLGMRSVLPVLLFASCAMPVLAQAGQTIIIDRAIGDEAVHGNGEPPDGARVADIPLRGPDNNTVIIAGNGKVDNANVYGGFAPDLSGDAAGNRVLVNGGDVGGYVYGGYTQARYEANRGSAINNSVTVKGGSIFADVTGGRAAGYGDAIGNSVFIAGGSVGAVVGGNTFRGAVSNNSVSVIDVAKVGGNVVGGEGDNVAAGNSVFISNTTEVDGAVAGAYASVSAGNRVFVSRAAVNGFIAGGYATSGDATANSVSVIGGQAGFSTDPYTIGALDPVPGIDDIGRAGATLDTGSVYGGVSQEGAATGNSVFISGASLSGEVFGGSGSALVADNTVIIAGSTVVAGEYVRGGWTDANDAKNNSVFISDGDVNKVIGGETANTVGEATHNSVFISGGTVHEALYGGVSSHVATGNIITLSDRPALDGVDIYGGWNRYDAVAPEDIFTGNTLNVWNYAGSPVGSVQNFEFYSFILPAHAKSTDASAFFASSADFMNPDNSGQSASISSVGFMGGGRVQQAGETFILMSGDFTGTIANDGGTIQGRKGATLVYDDVLIVQSGEEPGSFIAATIGQDPRASPEAKSLSEGIFSGVALINQGADLVSWRGISQAVAAAESKERRGTFGAVSGGRSRYNTGSHIKMNSVSLMAGTAWGKNLDGDSHLTLGGFVEYGNGSYDTYNAFASAASIHGDGRVYYFGAGALGRFDLANNVYAEGSFRFGKVRNRDNTTLTDAAGNRADYRSSSMYFSAHLGAGHVFNITDKNSLDLYGRYFWSRQGSDSVTLSTGDPVNFRSADSHRTRLGMRFGQDIGDGVLLYAGAALEYEFSGRAKADTYGYSMDAPSLKGSTGIGEFGVTFQPSEKRPLFIDLGIQGYVGKREGVTGSLRLKYAF